jgi:hypothetical protein
MDDPPTKIRTAAKARRRRRRCRRAAQRVKHRRAGSWQPMIAVRSGKLLKVVTSNFRELVAYIQGKMGKKCTNVMSQCAGTRAPATPPEAALH